MKRGTLSSREAIVTGEIHREATARLSTNTIRASCCPGQPAQYRGA